MRTPVGVPPSVPPLRNRTRSILHIKVNDRLCRSLSTTVRLRFRLADFLQSIGGFFIRGVQEKRFLEEIAGEFFSGVPGIELAVLQKHLAAIDIGFTVVISKSDGVLRLAFIEQVADQGQAEDLMVNRLR